MRWIWHFSLLYGAMPTNHVPNSFTMRMHWWKISLLYGGVRSHSNRISMLWLCGSTNTRLYSAIVPINYLNCHQCGHAAQKSGTWWSDSRILLFIELYVAKTRNIRAMDACLHAVSMGYTTYDIYEQRTQRKAGGKRERERKSVWISSYGIVK